MLLSPENSQAFLGGKLEISSSPAACKGGELEIFINPMACTGRELEMCRTEMISCLQIQGGEDALGTTKEPP